jgi:hypothetical protein
MELSILIARIASVSYLSIAIALMSGSIKIDELLDSFRRSSGLRLITGFFTIILGMIIVNYHNIWVRDWRLFVTLVGWIAVIKGALYIVFPEKLFKLSNKMLVNEKAGALVSLILGLLFAYFGFMTS